MIPSSSNFPQQFDSDDNLFLVHDGLRLTLADDYSPGDTSIVVQGDLVTLNRFPATGLITLTEQCSDVDKRAISFYYSSIDSSTGVISGLEILPGFEDCVKPKTITHVTQNVMDWHHNHVKDAIIAIQNFIGIKGTCDTNPFGPTLEGRINFLRKLVLVPKAWFTLNKRQGVVPLEVEFTDRSFRLGTDGTAGPVTITWDFGDHTSSTISYEMISATTQVPDDSVDVIVRDTDKGTIKKTYHVPGIYTVKMRVQNDFGYDELILDDVVHARIKAPNEAVIHYSQNTNLQIVTPGAPANGPYDTPPVIRSPINTLIHLGVPSGENPATSGYSYAGELLSENGSPLDPVTDWTWALGDDITHENSPTTTASFSTGGIYDLKLRVDTSMGAYRITTYDNSIDIVENTNLWLWTFKDDGVTARAYEYGLLSETFKLTPSNGLTVTRNESFLAGKNNEESQRREFRKNVGFSPKSSVTSSGRGGASILYWASGRNANDPISAEQIRVVEFQGFTDTYITRPSISRPWNWCHLPAGASSYFFGGETDNTFPNVSPVNTDLTQQNLVTMGVATSTIATENYLNGAQDLQQNAALYDANGTSIYGDFSVYRTTWKDNTGYIARNDAVGPFFRIKSFYRTLGTLSNQVTHIEKLTDIEGQSKVEGGMTNLSQGVYFFDNSGSVISFHPSTNLWYKGGPGVNSIAYRSLQDTSVEGFDSLSNTFQVASDGDKRAYISFDYSQGVFIKFTELDTTFTSLGSRPVGEQWIMAVY